MPEYVLRLEPGEQAPPLTPAAIENALKTHGLAPRHAARVDSGWWVQAGVPDPQALARLHVADGWRLADALPVREQKSWGEGAGSRAVGDVFAFALLTWPAVVALFEISTGGWGTAAVIAAGVWLALMHLVAYGGGRGALFGNSLLMLSGVVAAFWWTHPGPWMYAWLLVLLIGVYASVRGALKERSPPAPAPAAPAPEHGR